MVEDRGRPHRRRAMGRDGRGQANLVAVAVALVLVASVLGASIAVAESVLVGATTDRDAADRHAASTLAAQLVSDTPPSYPAGVIPNRTNLTTSEIETLAPVVAGAAVTVELDGRTLLDRGDAGGGVTVHRGVHVGTPQNRTRTIDLAETDTVTLAHRTRRVAFTLEPGPNTTIHTVRVNDRIVLHNDTGLVGEASVPTSVRRTTELTVEASRRPANGRPNPSTVDGRVEVSYTTLASEPATLTVTVDE